MAAQSSWLSITVPSGASLAFPATAILDTFNRDNGPLGANWDVFDTAAIVSNRCVVTGGIEWVAATFGPSAEVYADIPDLGAAKVVAMWLVTGSNESGDGYDFLYDNGTAFIERCDAGSIVQLGADITVTVSNGDSLGLRVASGQVEFWRRTSGAWTLVASRADTTYEIPGLVPGIYFDGPDAIVDSFGGGTMPVGYAVPPVINLNIPSYIG